jgi:hypothetical protein
VASTNFLDRGQHLAVQLHLIAREEERVSMDEATAIDVVDDLAQPADHKGRLLVSVLDLRYHRFDGGAEALGPMRVGHRSAVPVIRCSPRDDGSRDYFCAASGSSTTDRRLYSSQVLWNIFFGATVSRRTGRGALRRSLIGRRSVSLKSFFLLFAVALALASAGEFASAKKLGRDVPKR